MLVFSLADEDLTPLYTATALSSPNVLKTSGALYRPDREINAW